MVSLLGFIAIGVVVVAVVLIQSQNAPVVSGREGLIGEKGPVVKTDGGVIRARIHGEIWTVTVEESASQGVGGNGVLKKGDEVEVTAIDGMNLIVKKAE